MISRTKELNSIKENLKSTMITNEAIDSFWKREQSN